MQYSWIQEISIVADLSKEDIVLILEVQWSLGTCAILFIVVYYGQ
jgi:hypothetical protein